MSTITKPSPLLLMARGSYEGDGKYFTLALDSGAIVFDEKSYLIDYHECLKHIGCVVGPPRDMRGLTDITGKIQARPITLTYPSTGTVVNDHASSTLFPIGNLILERSPSLGVKVANYPKDGTRAFVTGYGMRHFRVGISRDTFMTIWNRINAFMREQELEEEDGLGYFWLKEWEDEFNVCDDSPGYFKVPNLLDRDGHYWLLARVPEPFVGIIQEHGVAKEVNVAALMKELEESLLCDAMAKFCLTKIGDDGEWELDMTILAASIIETTRQTSLARSYMPAHHLVGRKKDSAEEIVEAFNDLQCRQGSGSSAVTVTPSDV